jgi:hypothetical protein
MYCWAPWLYLTIMRSSSIASPSSLTVEQMTQPYGSTWAPSPSRLAGRRSCSSRATVS